MTTQYIGRLHSLNFANSYTAADFFTKTDFDKLSAVFSALTRRGPGSFKLSVADTPSKAVYLCADQARRYLANIRLSEPIEAVVSRLLVQVNLYRVTDGLFWDSFTIADREIKLPLELCSSSSSELERKLEGVK